MTSLCGRTASPSQMEHPMSTPQILLPTIITTVEEHIFLTGILLLLWGELILIASFLHFLQHLDFARGKKISVMKIPHVTRITSQTEHSWLWNSPQTPNGAYPYRKLESILKWKKDGAKMLSLSYDTWLAVDTQRGHTFSAKQDDNEKETSL